MIYPYPKILLKVLSLAFLFLPALACVFKNANQLMNEQGYGKEWIRKSEVPFNYISKKPFIMSLWNKNDHIHKLIIYALVDMFRIFFLILCRSLTFLFLVVFRALVIIVFLVRNLHLLIVGFVFFWFKLIWIEKIQRIWTNTFLKSTYISDTKPFYTSISILFEYCFRSLPQAFLIVICIHQVGKLDPFSLFKLSLSIFLALNGLLGLFFWSRIKVIHAIPLGIWDLRRLKAALRGNEKNQSTITSVPLSPHIKSQKDDLLEILTKENVDAQILTLIAIKITNISYKNHLLPILLL